MGKQKGLTFKLSTVKLSTPMELVGGPFWKVNPATPLYYKTIVSVLNCSLLSHLFRIVHRGWVVRPRRWESRRLRSRVVLELELKAAQGGFVVGLPGAALEHSIVLNLTKSLFSSQEYEDCYPCRYIGLGRRFRSGTNWPEGKCYTRRKGLSL